MFIFMRFLSLLNIPIIPPTFLHTLRIWSLKFRFSSRFTPSILMDCDCSTSNIILRKEMPIVNFKSECQTQDRRRDILLHWPLSQSFQRRERGGVIEQLVIEPGGLFQALRYWKDAKVKGTRKVFSRFTSVLNSAGPTISEPGTG